MRRIELAAVCTQRLSWEELNAAALPTIEPLGFSPGEGDVEVHLLDHGEQGRVAVLDNAALARRVALALAMRIGSPVNVFEVVGTVGNRFKFRTTAWQATGAGELKPAEGVELDLEDPNGGWIGTLAEQALQVLHAFSKLEYRAVRSERLALKKRKAGKPSSPRVAALLASLQKARSHYVTPQGEGRVELSIDLAAGGKQRSFCSTAEYEELQRLMGG